MNEKQIARPVPQYRPAELKSSETYRVPTDTAGLHEDLKFPKLPPSSRKHEALDCVKYSGRMIRPLTHDAPMTEKIPIPCEACRGTG
jgi:hypothetical protein